MLKKLFAFIFISILLVALTVPVFASAKESYGSDVETTEQFIITVTRPEYNETTSKKQYQICGSTEQEGVTVHLYIYKVESDNYEPFNNIDEVNSWEIGESGIFMKDVILPNDVNKLLIVAYKGSDSESVQISKFVVTYVEEDVLSKIKDSFSKMSEVLDDFFNSKK